MSEPLLPFASYAEVPWYRRHANGWVLLFVAMPVALMLLVTGDVYYVRDGQMRPFRRVNRIFATMMVSAYGSCFLYALLYYLIEGPPPPAR